LLTLNRGFLCRNRRRETSAPQCPLWVAGSTGRRNTGIKPLCRVSNSRVLQGRSVSWRATLVQVSWRIPQEVGSLGKILSEQAISALTGTVLPGFPQISALRNHETAASPLIHRYLRHVVRFQAKCCIDRLKSQSLAALLDDIS